MPQLDLGTFEFQACCAINLAFFCYILVRRKILFNISAGIHYRDAYCFDFVNKMEFHECHKYSIFIVKNEIFDIFYSKYYKICLNYFSVYYKNLLSINMENLKNSYYLFLYGYYKRKNLFYGKLINFSRV